MLSQEENDLLTRTGPGTPGGALLRRYWQPVALAEELPGNGAPLPVRIMSEDLVLFRDDQGQLGLIGLHCSHRRADLSYGRVENGGSTMSLSRLALRPARQLPRATVRTSKKDSARKFIIQRIRAMNRPGLFLLIWALANLRSFPPTNLFLRRPAMCL